MFICIFCHFPSSWIRIRIPDMDPDPEIGEPNQCGSGFTTRKIVMSCWQKIDISSKQFNKKLITPVLARLIC
jgi:hypothetical protein